MSKGILLILFELFKLQNLKNYHSDYFSQLESYISYYPDYDIIKVKNFRFGLLSSFSSLSQSRFRFAQAFCDYLKKFDL